MCTTSRRFWINTTPGVNSWDVKQHLYVVLTIFTYFCSAAGTSDFLVVAKRDRLLVTCVVVSQADFPCVKICWRVRWPEYGEVILLFKTGKVAPRRPVCLELPVAVNVYFFPCDANV